MTKEHVVALSEKDSLVAAVFRTASPSSSPFTARSPIPHFEKITFRKK